MSRWLADPDCGLRAGEACVSRGSGGGPQDGVRTPGEHEVLAGREVTDGAARALRPRAIATPRTG
jgi:hypothetical protein